MKNEYSKRSRKKNKELIENLKNFIRQNSSKFLEDKNISSLGIGLKVINGNRTNELCLQFTVDEKIELEHLENINTILIPKTIKIGDFEVPTDVLQRKYELTFEVIEAVSDNSRKARFDPIVPGVSICNVNGTAGTAGCIVFDTEDNTPYILSNWHVLHGGLGVLGDDIVQPGPHDDNRIALNRSGTLVRSHLGTAGDCAIASIENRGFDEEIYELNTKVRKLCEPELLDQVVKSGRTTGVTFGVIERIHVVSKINYGGNIGNQEIGCFEIGVDPDNVPSDGEISKGGDSGSIWLINKDNEASDIMAGLHFAGESNDNPHEHALACYPKSVFSKLGISPSKSIKTVTKRSNGYNNNFLKTEVKPPMLNDEDVAFELDGNVIIDYAHYSITLNKKESLPYGLRGI